MSVELVGLPEVLARLDAAVVAMAGPAAHETVHLVVAGAVAAAKGLVRVDSGELRDSIHAVAAGEAGTAAEDIVVGTDHALPNEFGTSTMTARPFLRPALHRAEQELPATAVAVYRRTVPGLTA